MPDPNNPQALNRYSYTLNNPMRYTDPTGNYSTGCYFCGGGGGIDQGSQLGFEIPDFNAQTSSFNFATSNNASPSYSSNYNRPSSQEFNIRTSGRGGNVPFVGSSSSSTGFFDNFSSPPNAFEFFFGPEAVGKPQPSLSERAIDTGTLFLGGPLAKVGAKVINSFSLFNKTPLTQLDEIFHFTNSKSIDSINRIGLIAGPEGVFGTPNRFLSPLQAFLGLALKPNRGFLMQSFVLISAK